MSIKSVMRKAANKIKPAIKRELRIQGHRLTGALENSLKDDITSDANGTRIQGSALAYARYLNDGFEPGSANWGQLPYLIKYFKLRGLSEKEAKQAAAATIATWMKEGMPTDNSKIYSRTNNRLKFIKIVDRAISNDINKEVLSGIKSEISKVFHKTKSEKI